MRQFAAVFISDADSRFGGLPFYPWCSSYHPS